MASDIPYHLISPELALNDAILLEAVSTYGSPLYVYDSSLMRKRWAMLYSTLPGDAELLYSVKANPNPSVISIFHSLGASFEVASAGEFASCFEAGVPPSKLFCVGPGKTSEELALYVEAGVKAIAVECIEELEIAGRLAERIAGSVPVVLRMSPLEGRDKQTMHGYSRFGFDSESIGEAFRVLDRFDALNFIGYNAYGGTGILKVTDFLADMDNILKTVDTVTSRYGRDLRFLNLGGGFGVPYTKTDPAPCWDEVRLPLKGKMDAFSKKYPTLKSIAFESGRYLTAESGVFLAKVHSVKRAGDEYFVILDGGTNVFPGFGLSYGMRATPVRVLASSLPDAENITLCGPLCTPTDRLAYRVTMPLPQPGEVVAFYQAGAYGYSLAPRLVHEPWFPKRGYIRRRDVLPGKGMLDVLRCEAMTTGRNQMDLVSVIIPTFNRADFISDAISSALKQTYEHIELIVIDDGSTDDTEAVVSRFVNDKRLKYVRQENTGVSAARNLGLSLAKGKIIAFLDSDDIWEEDKLDIQMDTLNRLPEVSGVFSDFSALYPDGRRSQSFMKTYFGVFDAYGLTYGNIYRGGFFASKWPVRGEISIYWGQVYDTMFFGNLILTSTAVFRREVFSEAGLFDTRYLSSEDYDLYLRITKKFPVSYVDSPLITYRLNDMQLSGPRFSTIAHANLLDFFEKNVREVRETNEAFYRQNRKKIKRRRGKLHAWLAYAYFGEEDLRSAAKHYFHGIINNPIDRNFLSSYIYLLFSIMPKGVIRLIRSLKTAIKKPS